MTYTIELNCIKVIFGGKDCIYIPITDFYDYMIRTSTPEELPNAPDIEDLTKSLRNSKYDWINELNNYIIHENYLLEYGTI